MNSMSKYIQIKNPRTGRYVKLDVETGKIAGHKQAKGPYKNITIVGEKQEEADLNETKN